MNFIMKGTLLFLFCAIGLAVSEEEIELYPNGCPVDPDIHLLMSHETYCNLFYNCVAGDLVKQICPGELVFNLEEQVCDWSSVVECKGKGIFVPDSEESSENATPSPEGTTRN